MAAASATAENLGQYVMFRLGDGCYGLAIDFLQEIIRVPEIIKVPLTPPYMRGLANLRGNILPVYDTTLRLGIKGTVNDESNRVIVVNVDGRRAGYVVDRVDGVVDIPAKDIEEFRDQDTAGGYVTSVARLNGEKLILLIEVDRMLMDADSSGSQIATRRDNGGFLKTNAGGESRVQEKERQLLTFRVGNEEYALDITEVQEVVHLPETWNTVPEAPPYVQGLVSLRERILPLISLRRIFGLAEGDTDSGRIVVTYVGRGRKNAVGLVVDSVAEVLRVPERLLEPVPPMVRQAGDEFTAICRLSDERMIFILDAAKLLRDDTFLKEWESESAAESAGNRRLILEEERQLVTFFIGHEEFALPIDKVREIIRVGQITAVPKTQDFVRGILNLRGSIVSVIDLRRKFGYQERAVDEQARILICEDGSSLLGILVDGVKEVTKIGISKIEEPPQVLAKEGLQSFVAGIAKFSAERNVMLLDYRQVFSWGKGEAKQEMDSRK